MHASLVVPSMTSLGTRPVPLIRGRVDEVRWPHLLSATLILILKVLVFASIVLYPWGSAE